MSAPEVLRAWRPVRNELMARAWSPGPSPFARPLSRVIPPITLTWLLYGSSGASVPVSRPRAPVSAGVQWAMLTPFGTYTNAIRFGAAAAAARPDVADCANPSDSSHGSATAV